MISDVNMPRCVFNGYTGFQTVRLQQVSIVTTVVPVLVIAGNCEVEWLHVEHSSFETFISADSVTMSDSAFVTSRVGRGISAEAGDGNVSISRTVFMDVDFNAEDASLAGNIFVTAVGLTVEATVFSNMTGFNSLLWIADSGTGPVEASGSSIRNALFLFNELIGGSALVVITGTQDISMAFSNVTMSNNSGTLLAARNYGGSVRLSSFTAENNTCGFSCLRFLPDDLRVDNGNDNAVVLIEDSQFRANLGDVINYSHVDLFLRTSVFVGNQPEGKDSSILHVCTRTSCGGLAFIEDTTFESTICSIGSSYITRCAMDNSGFSFAGVTGESRVEVSFCTLNDTVVDSGASVDVIVSFCNFTTTGKPPKTFTSPPLPLMAMAKEGGNMWFRYCRFEAFNNDPFSHSFAMVFVGARVALDKCWIGGFLTSENGGTIAMDTCNASISGCDFL